MHCELSVTLDAYSVSSPPWENPWYLQARKLTVVHVLFLSI